MASIAPFTRTLKLCLLVGVSCLWPTWSSAQAPSSPVQSRPRSVLAGDYQKKRLGLVDAAGKLLWEHKISQIHDLHLLANGNILTQTSFRNVVELNRAGEVVWRYDASSKPTQRVEIHAFQRLDNGNTMIAESGAARIVEVTSGGKIVHEIPLQVDNPHPHRDTRLVRRTPQGTYLVAHEGDQAVREYDRDGKVVWHYAVGSKVYSAVRLENGNTLIGTGDGHRVIEVSPRKQIVWSIEEQELPGIKLAWVTMVTRNDRGNTLVVNCHAGKENPQLIEVTPSKEVVWSFHDFTHFGNAMPVGIVVDGTWPTQ